MTIHHFKIGEKVRIIADTEGHKLRIGEILTIKAIAPPRYYIIRRDSDKDWFIVSYYDIEYVENVSATVL